LYERRERRKLSAADPAFRAVHIESMNVNVKRSTFLSTSTALLGASFLGNDLTSAKAKELSVVSNSAKPSIVFCHGIWADGSSFSKVIPPLQAQGYEAIAAQYGLNTNVDDVALVKATLERVSSPAILVGHSYGGSVITAAGTDDRVIGLVYIAAFAPDAGETSQSQQEKFPPTDVLKYAEVANGRIWLKQDGIPSFAGDLSEQDQKLVWATVYAPDAGLFGQNAPGVAWKTKPSWYIVAKNDHTIDPNYERFAAKRMGAKVTELDSSHVPMLSQPQAVVDVILNAAKAVQLQPA
jgi:pimeloyl-ACP methyl ester carboxylesterase